MGGCPWLRFAFLSMVCMWRTLERPISEHDSTLKAEETGGEEQLVFLLLQDLRHAGRGEGLRTSSYSERMMMKLMTDELLKPVQKTVQDRMLVASRQQPNLQQQMSISPCPSPP